MLFLHKYAPPHDNRKLTGNNIQEEPSIKEILIAQNTNSCIKYSSKEYIPKNVKNEFVILGIFFIVITHSMINAGIPNVNANI